MRDTPDARVLDGNTAAGALSELFTAELTAALAECTGCRVRAVLADAVLFMDAPGLVLRCSGCDNVLIRLVVSEARRWLDMRGVAVLELTGSHGDVRR